jgi:glucose/arabinose dehydrogenase
MYCAKNFSKSFRSKKLIPLILFFFIIVFAFSGVLSAASDIELEPVITGLDRPVAITHAGDGSGRLFITLLAGSILIFNGQQILPEPFLDIGALISAGGEQGLLSVAFHPHYASNGFLFVNYTDTNGDTVIARYSVSADPNRVDTASATILLTVPQPYGNHNGGQLQFGPDGFLYIGMGDGGGGGDPLNKAQTLGTLLGKILRIDVDEGFPYSIPADNPFMGHPAASKEIWALGLRNPWRFSFDRLTGDLFIADVGQQDIEEVNYQPADSEGGENYGWRLMEGSQCYEPSVNCYNDMLELPILEYDHSIGCSITGGYRYRGDENPGLWGTYFYGDFCSGRIWGAVENRNGEWTTTELLDTELRIASFGEDENGELYLAHFSSSNGIIYRILYTGTITNVEEFVTRFYQLFLERNPDPTGLKDWVAALLNGTQTGGDVAHGFVFSQEFANKNSSDEDYLILLYEAFFDRQADSAGLQGWLDALQRGASREQVLNGFIYAREFAEFCDEYDIRAYEGHFPKSQRESVAKFVTRFYRVLLERYPDQAGLDGWTNNLLNHSQTGADVAQGFVYSREFLARNTTNSEYLLMLYQAFFDRNPDPDGWDTWLGELNAGKDRAEVLNGFIYSLEFFELAQSFGIKAYGTGLQ